MPADTDGAGRQILPFHAWLPIRPKTMQLDALPQESSRAQDRHGPAKPLQTMPA